MGKNTHIIYNIIFDRRKFLTVLTSNAVRIMSGTIKNLSFTIVNYVFLNNFNNFDFLRYLRRI